MSSICYVIGLSLVRNLPIQSKVDPCNESLLRDLEVFGLSLRRKVVEVKWRHPVRQG